MAEARDSVTNELLLETLKSIQRTLSQHTEAFREVRERLSMLEMQYANLSRRVDRMDERLERIETRLELVSR